MQTDTYRKRRDTPLPIKWLSPESIKDMVIFTHDSATAFSFKFLLFAAPQEFSTQSDVWSFGIVLWEVFSLGATPYPGMEPAGLRLYEFLARGERMRQPEHAPGYVYDIMQHCWRSDPADRLTFGRIAELLVREIRWGIQLYILSLSLLNKNRLCSKTCGCNNIVL